MQANNRIQNAMINANAGIQGALVVDGANAHRAYPSFEPCESSPVSKCPGKGSRISKSMKVEHLRMRHSLGLRARYRLTTGSVGMAWRLERHLSQTPATIWATFVLNRTLCG